MQDGVLMRQLLVTRHSELHYRMRDASLRLRPPLSMTRLPDAIELVEHLSISVRRSFYLLPFTFYLCSITAARNYRAATRHRPPPSVRRRLPRRAARTAPPSAARPGKCSAKRAAARRRRSAQAPRPAAAAPARMGSPESTPRTA